MSASRWQALIVDDEPLAREELRRLLANCPSVEVCGEAANATQAMQRVRELRPQLLFLDIEMPGRNGFEFLAALPLPHPQVIFTTAYDTFAIRAFEVNALDYLLKPIDPRRLAAALEKLESRAAAVNEGAGGADGALPRAAAGGGEATEGAGETGNRREATEGAAEGMLREEDRVFVREGDRCWFVAVRSIRLLEAEDNFTRIYFDGEKPVLYRTLGSLAARLPARLFLRANRSQLVNLAFIETIDPWFSGSLKVRLRGGPEVEFSRRQAQLFRERLSL